MSYTKERRDNVHYKDYKGNSHEFEDTYINRDKWTARYDRYIDEDQLSVDFSRSRKEGWLWYSLKKSFAGYGNWCW